MTSDAARERESARVEENRRRRHTRVHLRDALERARTAQEEMQKPESDELERAVDRADAMNDAVREKREMVLDMELYGQLAAYSLERTRRLGPRGSAEVSAKAFLQAVMRAHGDGDGRGVRWDALGAASAKFFSEAPVPGFMNGVMDTEIKERRVTQRRAKEVLGPSVVPDAVQDTAAEKQTDKMMAAMNKKLKKRPGGATDVVNAVNNPESFPQFVENVFTAAFLVKSGHAGITPAAAGGLPTLSHEVAPPAGNNDRSSFVLHMDMTNWRALNKMLNFAPGMMPTREDVDEDVLYGARGVKRAAVDDESAQEASKRRGHRGTRLLDTTNSQ